MAGPTLSIAGAMVGNAVLPGLGGFIGAAAGGFLGGMIDNVLFAQNVTLPDVVGPRLADLRAQVSTYGKTIPQVHGRMRLAGNVIWSRDIQEIESTSTSSQGGKGGGGGSTTQTTTIYSYSVTLAIAICKGPIDEITRVWADSKAITSDELIEDNYEIHLGTEDQLPSTIIESYMGVGETSAYRGLCYVVIKDFPLEKYGNRIPNFTFEVKKQALPDDAVENKITGVNLIPGSGEFSYATTIIEKTVSNQGFETQDRAPLNMHNFNNQSNIKEALDDLERTLPNVEWVNLVIMWFATSKYISTMDIVPKVEFPLNIYDGEGIYPAQNSTTPDTWSVASYTRSTAQNVLSFPDGSLTYGGTPSDKSIQEAVAEIKSRGYKVAIYPFLAVDTLDTMSGEDNKPWRGRIEPTSSAECTTFYNKWRVMVEHYADLVGSTIDAIFIGTELRGLTTYKSGASYPFVSNLKTLAATVKSKVNASCLISYAADWSEYHSWNGDYHLDALWTDSNIDFVAIDAYFPLTEDIPQDQITYQKIYDGWESGEGWDYYYLDSENRTGLTLYSSPEYAWKNMHYWWSTARPSTGWTAKMKPLWFSEYGFPSVDGCSNQPNVFVDPSSVEGYYPRQSKQRVDFAAQRLALQASEDWFEYINGVSGNSDFIVQKFVWTWDARPFPYYPDRSDIWSDANLWKTGHWITGKLGSASLQSIVNDILDQVGISSSYRDTSRLTDQVLGYAITRLMTAKQAIEQLQLAYFFDCVESDGSLKFVKRGGSAIYDISEDDLYVFENGDSKEIFHVTRTPELKLPQRVQVKYLDRSQNYDTDAQMSQRQVTESKEQVTLELPIVLDDIDAKKISDVTLYNRWAGRNAYHFVLSNKYIDLEPTDIVNVTVNGVSHSIRLIQTNINKIGLIDCVGLSEDISSYDFYTEPGETPPTVIETLNTTPTVLTMYDLPAYPTDTDTQGILRMAIVPTKSSIWHGANVYRSDDGGSLGGNHWTLASGGTVAATQGISLNTLANSDCSVVDTENYLDVAINSGELISTTELAILNGANACLIGDEIIQFRDATLIGGDGKFFRLSYLMRGRLGTEWATNLHSSGERFCLLDAKLLKTSIPISFFGVDKYYKPVSVGDSLANTTEQTFTYTGKNLKPWSPVNVVGSRITDDLNISWTRRTRFGGELRDSVDIPLNEESEKYEVVIMDGSTEIRIIESTVSNATYTSEQQIEDFGSPLSSITINIYQISAIVGRGYPAEVIL